MMVEPVQVKLVANAGLDTSQTMPGGVVLVARQYMPVCSLVTSTVSPGRMGPEGSVVLVKENSCGSALPFWPGADEYAALVKLSTVTYVPLPVGRL